VAERVEGGCRLPLPLEPRALNCAAQRPAPDVAVLERSALARGEHVVVVAAVRRLELASTEQGDERRGQLDRAAGARRLQLDVAALAVKLVSDRHGAVLEVERAPLQAERLAEACARAGGEGEEAAVAVVCGPDQSLEFLAAQHATLTLVGAWALGAVEQANRVLTCPSEAATGEVEDSPRDRQISANRPRFSARLSHVLDQPRHVVNVDRVEATTIPAREQVRLQVPAVGGLSRRAQTRGLRFLPARRGLTEREPRCRRDTRALAHPRLHVREGRTGGLDPTLDTLPPLPAVRVSVSDLEGDLPVRPGPAVDAALNPLAPASLTRRGANGVEAGEVVRAGSLELNLATYQAAIDGKPLDFTYMEYELLKFLMTNPNRVFPRESLLNAVWGYDYYGGSRAVDVHVRRVRAKLGEKYASRLVTIRSVGYRFER